MNKNKRNLTKKTIKKSKKNNSKIRKNRSFFKNKLKGGGAYFGKASWNENMQNPYTMYSKNDYINDSSNPPLGNLSARNIGGGKKRQHTKRLKIKGGTPINASPLGLGTPIPNTVGFSFGSSAGSNSANILVGSELPLSSVPYDNSNYVSGIV